MNRILSLVLATLLTPSVAWGQQFWGNVPDGATYIFFTNTIAASGAPSGFGTAGTVGVVHDSGLTNTSGVSIDDNVNLGSGAITGLHAITVNTSDAFYTPGKAYNVYYTAGTVDSISVVGRVIGTFRIVASETVAGVPEVDITHIAGQTANPASGNVPADVQQWDAADVIVPTVPGVPEVNTTYVADQLASVASGNIDANVAAVGGTTVAAAGYIPSERSPWPETTVGTVTNTTVFNIASGPDRNNALRGLLAIVTRANGSDFGVAEVVSYSVSGSTKTVTLSRNPFLGGTSVVTNDKIKFSAK